MKAHVFRPARILPIVALAAGILSTQAALIQVGTGPDTSYLTLESPNLGIREYAVSYTYDPGQPLGTLDLLDRVDAFELDLSWVNGGSPANGYVASLTWMGTTEAGNNAPPYTPFWGQWLAGGQAGAESTPPFGPAPVPLPGSTWAFGSGISAPYRVVEPGSSDALVFGTGDDQPPTNAPIPEPSAVLLVALALPVLHLRIRRR